MKIVTNEQVVLDLILEHWNDPLEMDYKITLEKIREYWPITEYSYSLDWEFNLTPQSFVELSKRYLNQDLLMTSESYTLLVDSTNLSLKILSWEEYKEDIPRRMRRVILT